MAKTRNTQSLLRRLWRKPSAALSMIIIAGTALLALFAYLLSPDKTPDAARSIIELSAKNPGLSMLMLPVPKAIKPPSKNRLAALFTGTPDTVTYLPINGYQLRGDTLYARHYIDDGLEDTLRFAVASIMPEKRQHNPEEFLKEAVRKHRFWLGTDRYGRDILSRLLVGARVSMGVGMVAVLLSISIGVVLGLLAGYYRGRTDSAIMFLINILWAIPTLLLVFAITISIGKGFWQIFIAIGLTLWVSTARLLRGQVLVLREMDYIQAAKALGLSDRRILLHHILPNVAGPLLVLAAGNFATAILLEAGLSFLGIGVQPPAPSWGGMIKDHYNFLVTNRPFQALAPGLAILVLVYAFNILGNALRDELDVRR